MAVSASTDETRLVISAVDVTGEAMASAKRGLNDLGKSAETVTARMKSQMDSLKKNWLAAGAAIYAAQQTLMKAWDMAEASAKFEQSMMAFQTMVARAGRNAEEEFGKIRQASAGLVDDQAMVMAANRAISLGIPIENLAELMEIARAKARDMGTDTSQAFNDIATGIGRASPLILDNLGLILKIEAANQAYAKSIGKTVAELTEKDKKLAVLHATLEAGREAVNRHNLAVMTTNEKMQQLKATVKNIELWLGSAIIRAAAAGMGAMQALAGVVLRATSAINLLSYAVLIATGQEGQAAEAMRNVRAAWDAANNLAYKANENFSVAFAASKELAALATQNAAVENATPTGTAGGTSPAKVAAQKQIKEIEEVWRAAFPFAQELGRTYMEHVSGGMTEIMPEIVSDRLDITQALMDAEYQMELENARRKAEVWWGAAQTYISYAEQMTTMGVSMLLAEEGEREDIARRMLATTIRMLTQSLQAFMFMKAKEHLANALAAAGMIKTRQAQATTDMTIGGTMAAAWAAYYTAHSLNPYGGQAFIPAATAMTAAIAGFGAATAGINAAAVAGIATELSLAAAWAAGGILVGGIGEALAQKIESGGNATTTSSYSQSYTMPSGGTQTTTTETETRARPTVVNVTVNGSFFGDKAELAREIAAEVDKAKADGVH